MSRISPRVSSQHLRVATGSRRLRSGWLLGGWAALLVAACTGSAGDLFTRGAGGSGAGFGGLPGRGGRGGVGAGAGRGGGMGGEAGALGTPDGGAGMPDGGPVADAGTCADDTGCDDGNDCTADFCDDGRCGHSPVAQGVACGDDQSGDCQVPSCDGAGACVSGAVQSGSACPGGSCTLGECVQGRPVGCPAEVVDALPFEASWRTVGGVNLFDGSCDAADTPDFAVIFTAPASATYRFDGAGEVGMNDPETPQSEDPAASELADSVITIAEGACSGLGAPQRACDDDISQNNLDSCVALELNAGDTVTVYAGEVREQVPGGGSGTVRISVGDCD